ncbi:MAG: hypothetical protein ABSH20_17635, partial [Tepidisphaeraceae bacterium]
KIDFTALTWDPFDQAFIGSAQQPLNPTAAGGGGAGAAQTPPWDVYSIPLAIGNIGSIVQYTDWGSIAAGGAAGGGGGGGGGAAGATMQVNGLAIARNAEDDVILTALVQIIPTTAGDPVRGQLLQVATIPQGGTTFLPLNPAASAAMCRAGMAAQTYGLASWPAIAAVGDGVRPFLYSYEAGQVIRGSAMYLPVATDTGVSQVSLVEAAAFNPIDPNRLYFVPTLGGGGAAGGGGGGGTAATQLLCSIDLDPTLFSATGANATILQNTLRVGGAFPATDALNQPVHVTGIAFDQTGPATAVLHAINGNDGNVSGGVGVAAGANTVNLGRPGFNGNIPLIFAAAMGKVYGLVYIGSGMISRGGKVVGTTGENPNAAEAYAWTTTTANGHVELVRINPGSNRAMLWGAVDPEVEVGGLTFDPNAIDPITQQPGTLIASNPGLLVTNSPLRDTIFRIDPRFRPNECNIFENYVATSDSNSMQSIYQVWDPSRGPTYPVLTPVPYLEDVGPIRVSQAQGAPQPFTVSPVANTGIIYVGARQRKIFTTTPPYEDLWPVTNAQLRDSNGAASTTGFGLVPFGNGQIVSGMVVASTTTGAPQNFGRFLLDGALTGQVHISGSIDYFYTGWLLVGDPTTLPIDQYSPGGAVAGLLAAAQTYSNTDHAGDFVVGGDLRDLITLDTIGSIGGFTALTTITYLTRAKFVIGGRLGEIDGRGDLVGTVDVANTPNNAASMPLTEQIHEVEYQIVPQTDPGYLTALRAAFVAGYEAQPAFYNDTFATAQYVGAINSTRGNNVVDIAGAFQPDPTTVDDNDYYAVSLMAGQVIRLSQDNPLLTLELIDPDGRVDITNVGGGSPIAPFQWTTDRPGLWRIHVSIAAPHGTQPYDILMTSAPTDTYGMNIAIGAVHMTGNIFDANLLGTSFNARNGDMGALVSGAAMSMVSAPDVQMTEDQYETSGQPPQNALMGAAVNVTLGNLRAIQGATVADPTTDVYNGSVGLLSATGGDLVYNSDLAIPRTTDHDPVGTARQAAIGGDYQRIQVSGNLAAGLMANRRIGVINAGSWGTVTTEPLGFLVANADNRNRDGTVDLIDVTGDVGTALTGGPPITTGTGGNIRYMVVGGALHRDAFFGGIGEPDDATLYRPGESIPFVDDSGTPMLIQPVTTAIGGAPASITLRAYPVRGSGGSVVVNITSTDSVTVSAKGSSPLASVELGTVTVNGAGTAVAPNANGQFVAPPAGSPLLNVYFSGTAPVDVFSVTGGDLYTVQNTSKAIDSKRNTVDYGELVNVTANSIFSLNAGNIGVPKQSTDQAIIGNAARLNAFPFLAQTTGVLVGNLGYVTAVGAIGNIDSTGTIGQISPNSDNKTTPGALTGRVRVPLEGIVGPIFAAAGLNNVNVGAGMLASGTAPLFSWCGLYSNGLINSVAANGADIYGDIVSTTKINNVTVRNNGSLISSGIGVVTALTGMQKNGGVMAVTPLPNPVTDPTGYSLGSVSVQGAMPVRGKAAPQTGGIIGCRFAAGGINSIQVTRGFGVIDSSWTVDPQGGRINQISTDGYGLRDDTVVAGAIVGKVIASGNGTQLPSTGFSSSVRKSETVDIDPITHYPPSAASDLHRYLGTSTASPIIANDNNRAGITRSGVIAGTAIFASRDLTTFQAWRATFSNQLGAYTPTDLHLGNSIKTIQTTESMIDPQITTGTLTTLSVGKDLHSPNIHVSGLFSTLKIGGNYTVDPTSRTDEIDALGPNGMINSVTIGGRMDGNILATVSIGPHKVGNKTGTGKFYVNDVQIP